MVAFAKDRTPVAKTHPSASPVSSQDVKVAELETLHCANGAGTRADFFRDVKKAVAGGSSPSISDDALDKGLRSAEKISSSLDLNRDSRVSSQEIHSEVIKTVRALVAETPLNTGSLEDPKFSFVGKQILSHLDNRQSFLLPVLKEQRIFNNLLGSYNEALKAFDTAFPKGFDYEELRNAVDGLDGSKKDNRVSLTEIEAAGELHPKELEKINTHMHNALVKMAKAGEGICEYILARPELVESMEAAESGARERMEAARELTRAYRNLMKADSTKETLNALRNVDSSVAKVLEQE